MHVLIRVPAKINLQLDIGEKRTDGYHNILSIFQMISLYDMIHIRSLKKLNVFKLYGDFSCAVADNTISKAVQIFKEQTGLEVGLEIKVRKGIPTGSGLGGGSADAAAVLLGLNQLFHTDLSPAALQEMAIRIGSDVPFFLGTAAALVSGKGEVINPITPRTDYSLVLIYPGFPIQSRMAYQLLDKNGLCTSNLSMTESYAEELIKRYEQKPVNEWNFKNSFSAVLMKEYPVFGQLSRILQEAGSSYVNISGSGSTIYGVFTDWAGAQSVSRQLKIKNCFISVAKPLAINIKPIIKCF